MTIPAAQAQISTEELLRSFAEEISAELELQPLLSRIVEYACRLIGADDGTIGLHDPRRGVIRTAAVFRMPARELGAQMGPGVGLAGRVLQTGQPVVARYGDIAQITLPELADNQVIGMPIVWKGELTGFFGIGVAPPRRFADGTLQTLQIFARQAGIAIENARRYEQARRRTARFELVARVAQIINAGADLKSMLQRTADAIHDVLEFPNVDIPLLDPDDPEVLVVEVRGGGYKQKIQGVDRLRVDEGVMGAAVRQRRAQRVENVHADARYVVPPSTQGARAELAVPIFVAGEVVGVVNVEGEQPYDELDQNTIEIIADHLGIAIRNARLHEQNREAAVWQERMRLRGELHDSVTQILSSISLLSQALPSAWRRSPEEGERRAQRLAELAQTAFAEMRALLRDLLPPGDERVPIARQHRRFLGLERLRTGGLAAALPRLLEAMIPESLARTYSFDRYHPQHLQHEEALYRVCQEAVSNVIRHAGAGCVAIEARVDADHAWLSIRDDGTGLPADVQVGIGLKSMRDRLVRLGGELTLACPQSGGLEVFARTPRRDRVMESE